jgi:hypothetical protein
MNSRRLITITLFMLGMGVFTTLSAQNVLLSEDFANGIPADWTNEDVSGNGVIWTWCNDPAAGQGDGCPAIWNDQINQQMPFAAETATNGFVTVDSDAAGGAVTHTSELTIAPQDFSAQDAVWIAFQAHIGVFAFSAEENAILRVSNDGGTNWDTYIVFPGLTTGERWSANPEQIQLDISATAAGESNVLIQWQWTGNWEYNWNLDDVFIYDADPRPANDMRVNNFHAVAPNFATPASQVTPFGFIADIQNLGAQPQQDATLSVSISDAGGEVFSDELVYTLVGTDSTAENVFFENEFTPAMMPGAYTGQYELTLGEADANPEDNVRPFSFIVTDTLFQRDSGEGLGGTRPADDNDFSYGNVYYVANGENLFARYVTFGVSNFDEVAGFAVSTLLYEWTGDLDGDGQAAGDELTGPIAFNSYAFTGEEEGPLVTIPVDIDNNFPALQDDTYYIIVVQFAPDDDDSDLFLSTTSDIDYSASNFYQDSVGNKAIPYVALDVSNVGEFSLVGFGLDNIPVVRLSVGSATNNTVAQLPENSLEIMPSPANTQFQAIVNLETAAQEVTATLFSANGQVVETRNLSNIQQTTLDYNVSNLPAGNYYLRLQTEQGIRTLPVAVQH